ncbi:MAG TPA: DUF2975 domain-containing protein [Ideonella sp.]|nr:DUF2975 domain-containing protein [Ideonella sp.]
MSPLLTSAPETPVDPVLARRLRRLSSLVRGLILVGAPFLLIVPLSLVFSPNALAMLGMGDFSEEALRPLLIGDFTLATRLRCAAVSLISLGLWFAALWQLWQLFGRYRLGEVFSLRAVAHLRRFACWLLALAVAGPLVRALMSVAISLDNPVGKRMLRLDLSSNDYQLLLFAAVFLTVARVMAEALRVADENREFV